MEKIVSVKLKLSRTRKYHTLNRRIRRAIKVFSKRLNLKCYMVDSGWEGHDFYRNTFTCKLYFK